MITKNKYILTIIKYYAKLIMLLIGIWYSYVKKEEKKMYDILDDVDEEGCSLILPFIQPVKEILKEVETGCKNRKAILHICSNDYIKEHIVCMNEIFNTHYRKTELVYHNRDVEYYITIYSRKKLSKIAVYAIGVSYSDLRYKKSDCLSYIRQFYPEMKHFESRLRLCECVENGKLLVLDVAPKDLGLDPEALKWTKVFNAKKSDGRFKTVIKLYKDFDMVVTSNSCLDLSEVEILSKGYRQARFWVEENEENVELDELYQGMKKFGGLCYRKIKSYENRKDFVAIEIE